MTARPGVALALLLACSLRRDAPRARPEPHHAGDASHAPPPAPVPAPDAAIVCPWSWAPDTGLALDAPPESMPFDWMAACSGARLALILRTGTHLAVASRALTPTSRWSTPLAVSDDVATLGRPGAAAQGLWLTWITTTHTLRASLVDERARHVGAFAPPQDASLSSPQVLATHGDRALVVAGDRHAGADHVVLLRVGLNSASRASTLADGVLGAALQGPPTRVFVVTREPAARSGPWVLRAYDVDATRAMETSTASTASPFGVAPEGAITASAALGIGAGRFEFVTPTRAGALLFQTAVGAERGAAHVAWFDDTRAPALTTLPIAPSALGDALDAEGSAREVIATWWSDNLVPTRATVTTDGIRGSVTTGAAARDARSALVEARDTKLVWCGDVPWRIRASRSPAVVRFTAARVACDARG